MKTVATIMQKQIKDTLKNKTIFIQFVMFPILTIIMNSAVKLQGMPENFFVNLFATMYIGMAPLTSMAAVISEEKEKNTLRVLLLSGVKPWQYLTAVGGYLWCVCMLGGMVFAAVGRYIGAQAARFLFIMAIGILISILIGAAIGTFSRNQMAATSVTVPVMMVFSFLPMLSMFNETIEKAARFTYSEQISILMNQLGEKTFPAQSAVVIIVNGMLAFGCFAFAYRKRGL